MKKSFLAALCCLAVSAALLSSCRSFSKKEYFVGILEPEYYADNSAEDKAIFEKYLADKGFKNSGEGKTFGTYGTFTWNDGEKYEDVFDALWKPLESKLSYAEVDSLPLSDKFHVTVGVATGRSRSELSTEANWIYPDGSFSVSWQASDVPVVVPLAGADTTFTIECNLAWTATVDKDWVTFSPQSGEAGKRYTIRVSASAGAKDVATIEFKARRVEQPYKVIVARTDDNPLD